MMVVTATRSDPGPRGWLAALRHYGRYEIKYESLLLRSNHGPGVAARHPAGGTRTACPYVPPFRQSTALAFGSSRGRGAGWGIDSGNDGLPKGNLVVWASSTLSRRAWSRGAGSGWARDSAGIARVRLGTDSGGEGRRGVHPPMIRDHRRRVGNWDGVRLR